MFLQVTAQGAERLMTSASDLTAASTCEFAFLRRADERFGRELVVPKNDDPMLARAGDLGDVHEAAELERLRAVHGEAAPGAAHGVVAIQRVDPRDEQALAAAANDTIEALLGGAPIVFQATFFDPAQRAGNEEADEPDIGFLGFADFLELLPDGSYEVQDTKLARRAKVTALMQLAAYAEQLQRLGIPVSPTAALILGDGERSTHRIADIAPVFRRRRARLHELLLSRYAARGADGRRESAAVTRWGEAGVFACGRCEVCEPEVLRTRDPLLIAGIHPRQRERLLAAGLTTIDELAAALTAIESRQLSVAGLTGGVLERLALQAAVQVAAEDGGIPPVRVIAAHELSAIPAPDAGDLFFDFEGDPFYQETGVDGSTIWNLDYLFGMVDVDDQFTPLWAHTFAEEKQALEAFIALVTERRRRYPGMHIYHYASYERTHLLSLAARHGTCEAEVDQLLRDHVLVDLYPIVRRALRVGSRSYSIKKLEPLYMGDELRDSDGVTDGAQSVVEYAEASAQLAATDGAQRRAGQTRLDRIADYNRYDCVSTLRLRDWLLGIAREHGVDPVPFDLLPPEETAPVALSPVATELLQLASHQEEPAKHMALRLAASAIDYHEREQKSFWWAHYARLTDPIEDWADTRDVVVVEAALSEIEADWHLPPRARAQRRHVRLRGTVAPGSTLKTGTDAFAVYDRPLPFATQVRAPGARGVRRVKILERFDDGANIEELLASDTEPYDELPIALVPGPPPPAGQQKTAIEEWGRAFAEAEAAGREFKDAALAVLLRATPRLAGGRSLASPSSPEALLAGGTDNHRMIGAVLESLRGLEHSALAVQGPPGTGKTYLAAHVITELVQNDGWRIGVVAQSHRVVENVLDGVVDAGLDPARVGKVPQSGSEQAAALGQPAPRFTQLKRDGHAAFLEQHRSHGAVIGGTAWDFAHAGRVARNGLNLLVIDEAGQFSLAPTIAASVSATRLLLLGDPQQLPQVSQGVHPEPVDTSALSWLLGDHDTMPDGLGYFLADTRRMHPELATVISDLSYEGRLHAHPSTSQRELVSRDSTELPPGLVWHAVPHSGNSTYSEEEAEEVVRIVARLLGATAGVQADAPAPFAVQTVHPETGQRREQPLTSSDLIVVAAYNAQVECIHEALARAGLTGVRVGTVDRFQGQEAAVSIVSLAASSAADVPRGIEFLLMRNRLNVAMSRAQWVTYLVSAPSLGDGLPSAADGVAALSGYLRLLEQAVVPVTPVEG